MVVREEAPTNFEFAFNDADCSDRVLRIEIMEDSLEHEGDEHVPNRKRTREDLEKENGDDVTHSHGSNFSRVIEVQTFYICSPILAAKSPFFYKLFRNGMKESQGRGEVTLKVDTSEKTSFLDLLKFMYSNTLRSTTVPDLLGVFVIADKFHVFSCMRYCIEQLSMIPMSIESALLCLELPSCVTANEIVQPFIQDTEIYLGAHNWDISKQEMMDLSLSAVEIILDCGGVLALSEDHVFDFVLKWARENFPDLEERRNTLSKRLPLLLCFRNMSSMKLKDVLDCPEFDHDQACKLVIDALYFKAEGRSMHPSITNLSAANFGFVRRIYVRHPIRVVQLGLPQPCSVVYLELKKEECADLYRSRSIVSDSFYLAGQQFSLSPQCSKNPCTSLYRFGLHVLVYANSPNFMFDCEIEVMKKSLEVFTSMSKSQTYKCFPGQAKVLVFPNLCRMEWKDFMCDESEYFIDGILRLRVTLRIKYVGNAQ